MTGTINDFSTRHVNRELLRGAVMQQIVCPCKHCGGAVLDARRAVLVGDMVLTAECWDAQKHEVYAVLDAAKAEGRLRPDYLPVIIEGRELGPA